MNNFCTSCQDYVEPVHEGDRRCSVCGEVLTQSNTSHLETTTEGINDISTLMNRLLEAWGIDPNNQEAKQPASEEAVAKLSNFQAGQAITCEVGMVVSGIKGEVIIVPGNFGPCTSIPLSDLIVANPFNGANSLINDVKNKIVIMERGNCTFASKALRAQESGAIAVIIVQTADVWPYTMTDSTGEGNALNIPVFMISSKQGKGLVEYLSTHKAQATIDVRENARECVICQVDIDKADQVTRMPCQHIFHTECLGQWLKIGNSCPICRVEIASKHGRKRTEAEREYLWSDWMS
ncbi:hypothetical protein THRCLA_03353 [Thraustotheca clavata]|uniref:RING-type E3 ubiquitin transferase n=1 Tax=Thraustotheca clavata TaxID=74557 RepID=A0A1W0A2B9_9STRA|nr:hypothetical protein THRCLA_03353 [Thraustotheca clavata]